MNKLKKFLFLGLLTVNNTSSTDVIKSNIEYNNSIGSSSHVEIEKAEEVKKTSFFNSIVDGLQNTKWLLKNKSFLKIGTVMVLSTTVLEAYFSNDILSVQKLVSLLLKNVSECGLGAILAGQISILFGFTDKDQEINFNQWKVHGKFLNNNTLENFKHSMFFPTVVKGPISSFKLDSYNNQDTKQTIKLFFNNGLCIVCTKEGPINTHDKKIVYKFLQEHHRKLVEENIVFAHESEKLKNPFLSFEPIIQEENISANNLPVKNEEKELSTNQINKEAIKEEGFLNTQKSF